MCCISINLSWIKGYQRRTYCITFIYQAHWLIVRCRPVTASCKHGWLKATPCCHCPERERLRLHSVRLGAISIPHQKCCLCEVSITFKRPWTWRSRNRAISRWGLLHMTCRTRKLSSPGWRQHRPPSKFSLEAIKNNSNLEDLSWI